jgi:hypothetical protein
MTPIELEAIVPVADTGIEVQEAFEAARRRAN